MYGETFYGRHTAQHQLQWSQIKIRNEILKEQWKHSANTSDTEAPFFGFAFIYFKRICFI